MPELQGHVTEAPFTQLCVWEGTTLGEYSPADFEKFILDNLGARIRFAEVVITGPGNGGPGGRSDLFFYVHTDDIGKFAIRRLAYGIRWWEDVLSNGNGILYPTEILNKYKNTWEDKNQD